VYINIERELAQSPPHLLQGCGAVAYLISTGFVRACFASIKFQRHTFFFKSIGFLGAKRKIFLVIVFIISSMYNKKFNFSVIILLFIITVFSSCRDKIDKEIRILIENDAEIDTKDWDSIILYLENNKADNNRFFKNDSIDTHKLQSYIVSRGNKMRPALDIKFSTSQLSFDPVSICFYLERSGSMVPYDAPQCAGEFKSAIVDLLNHFPHANNPNTLIYIVKYP
jgi:hypothetical protein